MLCSRKPVIAICAPLLLLWGCGGADPATVSGGNSTVDGQIADVATLDADAGALADVVPPDGTDIASNFGLLDAVKTGVDAPLDQTADATQADGEDADGEDVKDIAVVIGLPCLTVADCDAANPCVTPTCGAAQHCVYTPIGDGSPCTDGNSCTFPDACVGGICNGDPVVCAPDSNPCTVAVCDSNDGCIQAPKIGTCNDKDPCTKIDTCVDSTCIGAGAADCDDKDTCSDDSCVKGQGCAHTLAAICLDGDPCTLDSCTIANGCAHQTLPVGAACEDGEPCTAWDTCGLNASKKLVCVGGSAASCDDGNACTADSCKQGVGCQYVPKFGPCDDFDPCTIPDLCAGDYCVGGAVHPCADDGNACTVEFCASAAPVGFAAVPAGLDGCVHAAVAAACEDGSVCSAGDVCKNAVCTAGVLNGCDDKNSCTLDTCLGVSDGCAHTPTFKAGPCDDGTACTTADICDVLSGNCKGKAISCDDKDPCTADTCDVVSGCHSSAPCDDGDPCTQDSCANGVCGHSPLFLFKDDFSAGNAKGWTLDAEWQIGPAKAGICGDLVPGDPATDHSVGLDNGEAGVVIGGVEERVTHGFRYLTSPTIDISGMNYPALEFWRWLNADMAPYMHNTIDVFNGTSWHTIWKSPAETVIADKTWVRVARDLSKYKSQKFRFRMGFSIPDGNKVLAVGSWNIDDVTIGGSWTCIENPLP